MQVKLKENSITTKQNGCLIHHVALGCLRQWGWWWKPQKKYIKTSVKGRLFTDDSHVYIHERSRVNCQWENVDKW